MQDKDLPFDNIPIDLIDANPRNPRGIDIETEDTKLASLKDSIDDYGVMVPIIVSKRSGDRYFLIDGERRFRASKQLKKETIPAYIIDPDGTMDKREILYRMFQIHHNRSQWDPVQQCNALEPTFQKALRSTAIASIQDHKAKIKALTEKVVTATGIDERLATDRIYFLLWPDDVKNVLYKNPQEEGYRYICEIEDKVITPTITNYPEYFDKVRVNDVRRSLFDKLESQAAHKSTDVRCVAPFFRTNFTKEADRKFVKRVLCDLCTRREMTYADAQLELLNHFPSFHNSGPVSPRRLHSLMTALELAVQDFDTDAIGTAKRRGKASTDELVKEIRSLIATLQELLSHLEDVQK